MRHFQVPILLVVALALSACGGTGTSAPEITSFTANPETVAPGETVTLSWAVSGNIRILSLTQDLGDAYSPIDVTGKTSHTERPTATLTYLLTAEGAGGRDEASLVVTVTGTTP